MLEAAIMFIFGVSILLWGIVKNQGVFIVFASIMFVISLGASFTKQIDVTANNPEPDVTETQDLNYGIIYGSTGMFLISIVMLIYGIFNSMHGGF